LPTSTAAYVGKVWRDADGLLDSLTWPDSVVAFAAFDWQRPVGRVRLFRGADGDLWGEFRPAPHFDTHAIPLYLSPAYIRDSIVEVGVLGEHPDPDVEPIRPLDADD
jgi:hypothetical protein